ncbi:hypothetical protein EI94DRAFT_60003 [Lactarius quietus]|nr:hypothetical protein EI94DRAFT_60003 [Lactarius quietus]
MSLPVFLLLVSPNSHLTCLHLLLPVFTPSPNEDSLKFIPKTGRTQARRTRALNPPGPLSLSTHPQLRDSRTL